MLVWLNGQPERQGPAERELRPRADGAVHARRRPRRLHRDRRPRAGAGAHRLARHVVNGEHGVHATTPSSHDAGTKTIFGKTGNFDWQDSCQLCLDHPLHASYFVDEAVELLRPDAPDSDDRRRARQALYAGRQIRPVVEAILMHPALLHGPADGQAAGRLNAGLLRMRGRCVDTSTWWTLGQPAGQRLFYPPDVGGLGRHALARHRAPSAPAGSSRRSRRAPPTPTDSAARSGQARRPRAPVLGPPDAHGPTTQEPAAAFAAAQLKRKHRRRRSSRPRCAGSSPSSPDLQTA